MFPQIANSMSLNKKLLPLKVKKLGGSRSNTPILTCPGGKLAGCPTKIIQGNLSISVNPSLGHLCKVPFTIESNIPGTRRTSRYLWGP